MPNVLWCLPFAILLAVIAVLPLLPRTSHWWEHHRNKLAIGLILGGIVLGYYGLRGYGYSENGHETAAGWPTLVAVLNHAVVDEYAPFIILLFSLYAIAGGMHLRGSIPPRPVVNTAILALGTVLASVIGTTGASMLLIVPLLDANRSRTRVTHTVVFFIFLVANIGGLLTPLGDPPLFLGYLQGVPFTWTLRLWLIWLIASGLVLGIYYIWDRIAYAFEPSIQPSAFGRLELRGGINLLWLLGIVLSVAFLIPGKTLPGTDVTVPRFAREVVMLAFVALSIATTPRGLKNDAGFTYGAMSEVACLFLGVFLTMRVPIEILQARGATLGLTTPGQFFWTCGALSAVLDNAPTYMVFFETARSLPPGGNAVLLLGGGPPIRQDLLAAVSCGAVLMGAASYIGNGPNLMVKSIAESRGVKMPGFFGYILYSTAMLVPVYAVIWWQFFS